MGFNVVALAQKPRTRTLIVDSDLDMGNYDLIATDVKGDTAEFSEFVGGVGNFESGLISGGLDVGDILHAESSMQIDGDLVVEGAINNVNITNEGAISTAKGISASTGTFSGAVTASKFAPTSTTTINVASGTPTTNGTAYDAQNHVLIFVLPDVPKTQYTGSIKVTNQEGNATSIYYNTKWGQNLSPINISANATGTISFTNVPHVYIFASTRGVKLGDITFS